MDEGGGAGSGGGGQQPASGAGGWGGGGDAPLPPIFGNANAEAGHEFKGMDLNLDDVFSGVFFSPDGDLLDIPSDGDESLNLTLSSTSISEGTTHTPFAQFAVLSGRPGDGDAAAAAAAGGVSAEAAAAAAGAGEAIGEGAGVMPSVTRSSRQLRDLLNLPGGGQGSMMDIDDSGAAAWVGPQLVGAAPGVVAGLSPQGAFVGGGGGVSTQEAAAAAAAEAVAAAEQARAAQQLAASKAEQAVQAAAAHAQAQTSTPFAAGGVAEKAHPIPAAGAVGGVLLPTPTAAPVAAGASSLPPRGGGISAATTGGGVSVAWGRGPHSGAGATAAPRRQRHKVSSKDLTEEQRIERRERNREHAKRSRVRKKFLLDSLQRSVDAIQAENESLKGSIVGSLGERGRELVAKCMPADTGGSLVTANNKQATKILDDPDYSLVKALQTAQQNFVITDASLPDNPIVFASGGFLALTRYKLTEVLGRNCRFLQGAETDPKAVDKIRKAIDEGYDTSVCLLNYRADGTTFWNQFFVASLRDGNGNTVNYVGVQCKVGDDYAKIVVNEQNRQLAGPSKTRTRPLPSIPPDTGGASAAAAAAPPAAAEAGAAGKKGSGV